MMSVSRRVSFPAGDVTVGAMARKREREKQKAPCPVDRLSRGVELMLKDEVKPYCSQGDLCFNALHPNLSPSSSLAG